MKIKSILENFYKGKKVFITGCTGFKGSWLCQILLQFGSNVMGYSLKQDDISLFNILKLGDKINSIIADIRDYNKLREAIFSFQPDIIIHLAAQPLVIDGYKNPRYTYDVNVMGTVNICDIVKEITWKCSFLNVTTDKVYFNKEEEYKYNENDVLKGLDPYSNSKSCSELVTYSYKESYYNSLDNISASTCRSGNVIGGGDFAPNRIIVDCFYACSNDKPLTLRYPNSIRPYQFVLEPLFLYLNLCMQQYNNKKFESSYNIGPNDTDILKTIEISKKFIKYWKSNIEINLNNPNYHESILLMLDNKKIKETFNWRPTLTIDEAIEWTSDWYKKYFNNNNMVDFTNFQINNFLERIK